MSERIDMEGDMHMDTLAILQEKLADLDKQIAPLERLRNQLRKEIDAIKTADLERQVGLKEGDALIVTQEFCDLVRMNNGSTWPFELGGRATCGSVHDIHGEPAATVYGSDYVGGTCIPSVSIEYVQHMRDEFKRRETVT